jgi:lysophospholipase L1-like esterase
MHGYTDGEMMARRLTIGLAALALLAGSAEAQAAARWVGAYGAPPIGYEPRIRDALGRPFRNDTVRQVVRVSTAGNAIRIRLSNELGDSPLRVGAASVGRIGSDGKPVPGSLVPLTFGGGRSVVIPANAPYLSDSLPFPVAAGEEIAIALFYPDEASPPAHAQMADVGTGDLTLDAEATMQQSRVPGLVSEVDVSSAAPRVLVAFGDSITEGAGATPGKAMSWPEQLGRLLAASPRNRCWSIVNSGISGNRLLHDGRGPNALARFDRDVLAVAGATHVVLLEGINDIGRISDPARLDQAVTADQIIAALDQLVDRAHASGLKVIVGTLLPYEGAAYADAEGEAKRSAVNRWIRDHARMFDGLIDFDAAMAEPGRPKVMRLAEQIGDHLHPNDAGYTRMAKTAFDLVAKERCPAK